MDHSDLIDITSLTGFDRRTVNGRLAPSRASLNAALIGTPRGSYSTQCQAPESPDFIRLLATEDIGPCRATGLRVVLAQLRRIFADVAAADPVLHARLGSAGVLCCRRVRGSRTVPSNHAWGLAIDVTIDGKVCPRGKGQLQRGLLGLAPHFRRHGFYWGIAFPTDDAMHFEASEQLVRAWAADGAFGAPRFRRMATSTELTLGDRGAGVMALQKALNGTLAPVRVIEDGLFGPETHLAVIAAQTALRRPPSGRASRRFVAPIEAATAGQHEEA